MNKKKNQTQSFLEGATWLALSTLILKIIGLIYKIPLSYMLGDEGMGYFNSAYTVYVFFYVIGTAGIPKSISIITAKKEAETVGAGRAVFELSFKFFLFAGVLLLAVFLAFADLFARVIGNEKSVLAMYSIAPSMLFVCAAGVIRGYLAGKMKFSKIAFSELISGVLKLVLGLLFAYLGMKTGKNLPTIAAYTILGITIGSLASLIYLFTVANTKRLSYTRVSAREIIGDILKIAIPITLASALGSIVNILDLSIIMNGLELKGYNTSISNVLYGNYTTLAVPMASLVSTLVAPITTAMLPVLASSFVQKGTDEYGKHLYSALALTSLISVPAAIVFALFPTELLSIIFEQSSAVLGAPFLFALAPGVLILGPLNVLNTAIEAAEKPVVVLISLAFGAAVKLFIGICLLKFTDAGVLAAPIGTSASYLASYIVARVYLKKISNLKFPVIRSTAAPLVASAIATCVACLSVKMLGFIVSARVKGIAIIVFFSISYLTSSLFISPKARFCVLKCVKLNKKESRQL